MKKQIFLITLLFTILVSLSGCQFIPHHYTNIGPTIKKNMTQQNFNEIDADVSLLDFNLQVSGHPKVIYHGGKKIMPIVKVRNGKLIIRDHHHVLININSNENNYLTIYLPKKQLAKIKINTDDGDITCYGQVKTQKLAFHSDDGDINADYFNVTNGSVSSDDGDIQIKDLRSLAGFKATSSDGDISIKKCDASGVDLNSDDGDVIYHRHNYNNDDGCSYQHNLHSKNVLIANSDDGDIKVNN